MNEYRRLPDETSRIVVDGWLYTADMGYYDDKAFLYIVDRKKHVINTGGQNVYSREVESVLYRHPSVFECAVIGIPDDELVERVHALIVSKQGQNCTAEVIIAFCRERLSAYKTPKSIEFVDALPKNRRGEILKTKLKDRYRK